jgi:hypothetical protein
MLQEGGAPYASHSTFKSTWLAKTGRPSFLKKRSKKLLFFGANLTGSARHVTKVFWFFFSKKNPCLHLPFQPAYEGAAMGVTT